MRACETSAAAIAVVLGMMLAFPKGAESFCFETGGRSAVTASTAGVKGAGFGLSGGGGGGGGGGGSPGMAASSRRDCRLSDHQKLSMGSLDDISTDGEKETSSSAAAAAAAAAAAEHPKPGESASTLKSNGAPSSSTSFSGAGASYLENLMPSSSSSSSPPEDTRRNFFSNGASDKFSFSRGEKENIVKERERKAVSESAASTPPPSLENGVAAAAAKRNRLPAGDGDDDDDDGAIGERMFLPRPPSVPPPPSSYMSKVPPAPASSHRGSAASWSQEQKPPDSSERNARASSSFSSSKGRTNPSESDLERLKESMPEPSVVKSALSSFSSYMESISSQFADKFSMSKERSVEVDDLIQKARTAATMPKAKGKVAEDGGGGVGQRPRASARASPQSEWIVPPSRPSGSASVPLPKTTTTTTTKPIPAAVRSQASRDEFSTVPKNRALVPINDSTIEFTSGLIGGIVGLAIGGPVAGAVAAAAANYVSKREEEVGDVVRAVSKSAMQCYNYLVNLDAKYRALETARESLGAAYDGIRTDRNADPLFVKRIERALRKTSERLVEMNDEYDLVDTGLVALGVIGDLVEIAVTKVDELNREYKLTDRAWSAVTRRGTSSVRKLPPGRND